MRNQSFLMGQLAVENCISLDTAQLRQLGLLTGRRTGSFNQKWRTSDSKVVGDVWLAVEARNDSLALTIDGTCFGIPIRQAIRLVEKSMPFGGRRFYLEDPHPRGGICCKVILPPGGVSFASVAASGLPYRSQSQDAAERGYVAIRKVEQRIGQLSPRAHKGTRIKLREQQTEREAYMARINEYVATTLASGKRFSLRKAAQWAKENCKPNGM